MARKISVVISQGQSANPAKRNLEEDLVAALLMERGVEVAVIPNLYDLSPDGSGMLCLQGIGGDMIVVSWLYPRAAHWTLNRDGIRGKIGVTLLKGEEDEEDSDDESAQDEKNVAEEAKEGVEAQRDVPHRTIYCLDFRAATSAQPFVEEIRRIASEKTVQTFDLMGWINGAPDQNALNRYLNPAQGNVAAEHAPANGNAATASHSDNAPAVVVRVEEEPARRWYPVIDFSRCTNCLECLDFCLFGVYGVDKAETILVEQPDNCRKGCPACSRVCPENAIIFPQHKTAAIAGGEDQAGGGFKIDLSKLFGAPDAVELAAAERDHELVAVGRDAVGLSVGIPKRQEKSADAPKDHLDKLMDQLDAMDI